MALTSEELTLLNQALIDCFDQNSLEQLLLLDAGGKRLDILSPNGNFKNVVFAVCKAAEKEGWTNLLIAAAVKKRPKSPELQALCVRHSPEAFPGREPPPLLPFFCDRKEQRRVLARALEQPEEGDRFRPLVCVIHGNEDECHDEFVEWLRRDLFPQLPGMDGERDAVRHCDLHWLPRERSIDQLGSHLREKLAEQVLCPLNSPLVEVARFLGMFKVVVMETHLDTEYWQRGGTATLEEFLRFWSGWPSLSPGCRLIACMKLEYSQSLPGFGKWLARLCPPLGRVLVERRNETIRTFLRDRPKKACPPGVRLLVLDELRAVDKLEALEWARFVSRQFRECKDPASHVRALYKDRDQIPLSELAKELQLIYRRCCPA
jgi:hypothetical protein